MAIWVHSQFSEIVSVVALVSPVWISLLIGLNRAYLTFFDDSQRQYNELVKCRNELKEVRTYMLGEVDKSHAKLEKTVKEAEQFL